MSTVMRLLAPDSSPAQRPPMTPAAGPDNRIVTERSQPCSRVVIPPFDCMRRIGAATPRWRKLDCRLLR